MLLVLEQGRVALPTAYPLAEATNRTMIQLSIVGLIGLYFLASDIAILQCSSYTTSCELWFPAVQVY